MESEYSKEQKNHKYKKLRMLNNNRIRYKKLKGIFD